MQKHEKPLQERKNCGTVTFVDRLRYGKITGRTPTESDGQMG
jgi:hypothetical protein